jgi:hypothetical protein
MIAQLSETFALLAGETSGHLVSLSDSKGCKIADKQDIFNDKLAVASYEAAKLQGVSLLYSRSTGPRLMK